MADKPPLQFEIILNFPGEPRISDYRPASFDVAVEYALGFARRNPGVKVEVNVPVPMSPIHEHSYQLFICEFPVLEPFMQKAVRDHFGKLPY